MNEELKKIIKKIKGSLILVAVNNSYVLDTVYKNNSITEMYSLDRTKLFNKDKRIKKGTSVKIRKVKKKFKDSNKLDYMLCDVNGINIDLNRVIYNTYNIIGKKIIFYGIYDEYDVDRIVKKYQRYGCICHKKMYDKEFILEVDTNKINVKKGFVHKIGDIFTDIIEGIGNLLIG